MLPIQLGKVGVRFTNGKRRFPLSVIDYLDMFGDCNDDYEDLYGLFLLTPTYGLWIIPVGIFRYIMFLVVNLD